MVKSLHRERIRIFLKYNGKKINSSSSSSRIGFEALALGNFSPFTVHVLSQFVVNIAVSTSA